MESNKEGKYTTVSIRKELLPKLLQVRESLEAQIGFSPNVSETVSYLLHFYLNNRNGHETP